MAEAHHLDIWEGYVDWRNRPAIRGCHGGMLAASFVLVVEILENLAFLANASNLLMLTSPPIAIYLISAAIEFMGLLILTIQAQIPSLRPPTCLSVLIPPHGAQQFDETTQQGRKQRSAFFNYYVFCLSCGALVAVTFVALLNTGPKFPQEVQLQLCLRLLLQQFAMPAKLENPSNAVTNMAITPSYTNDPSEREENISQTPSESLKFLNRAVTIRPVHPMLKCTVKQVEEVKIVLKILPILMSTIMLNCCLAQLSTFSVQQAATMNTQLGSFKRIGIGLILSVIAMAVAAVVEIKRKNVAAKYGLLDSAEPLPITFLLVALQYLFLGSADLFTLAGMMEFFFTEAPMSMRSLATALSWASLAMGYYLSSVLVSVVNDVTGAYWHTPWLFGDNLNHYHLERFYWLMCVLSGLNFLYYLLWASRYKYRSTGSDFKENQNPTTL
ncbi:hypothetical protein L3X38_029357 [Prunus dulcis]|uniref:Major facilitator superfamily protein n=1 Tax=Prunus dulcis TaxID=3755 RepID=A0AAD4VRH0_PRUDU|nr:hypothetical protein L3X38_029357 [Prunus dulcis]